MQRVFEALSSTVRRKILAYLTHTELSAGEIAARFDISKPSVSQHLSVLEGAGLVRTEKVGRVRTCTLDSGALQMAEQWINARRIAWEQRLDRLGAYLAANPDMPEGDDR